MRTTKTGTPAADPLQVQRSVIIDTIVDCNDRRRAVYLPVADIGHFGRNYGHELDVGFERQGGHVDDAAGDVLDVHARLGFDPAHVDLAERTYSTNQEREQGG